MMAPPPARTARQGQSSLRAQSYATPAFVLVQAKQKHGLKNPLDWLTSPPRPLHRRDSFDRLAYY